MRGLTLVITLLMVIVLGGSVNAKRRSRKKSTRPPRKALQLLNKGIESAQKKAYDTAVDAFTEALKLHPHFSKAYYNLGLVYKVQHLEEAAVPMFLKAIEYDSSFDSAYYQLGMAFFTARAHKAALGAFETMLTLYKSDGEKKRKRARILNAHFRLGSTYYELKEYKSALTHFEEILRLQENHHSTWYHVGRIHMKLKAFKEAVKALKRATEIAPKNGKYFFRLAFAYRGLKDSTHMRESFSDACDNGYRKACKYR